VHSKPRLQGTAGGNGPSCRSLRALIAMAVVSAFAAAGATAATFQSDPLDEQRAINAADQRIAQSVVIRPGDIPGWRAFGRYPSGSASCPKFKPDFSDVTITGDKRGRQFGRPNSSINEALTSAAAVYESSADALRKWRAWTSPASVECLRKQIEESAPGAPGVAITVTAEVVPLRLPRVAPRQFARRYKLFWIGTGGDFGIVYVDDIYLVRDRADASLLVQRIGPPDKPPTATVERQAVRLLGDRLEAAFP
jgi:hypothetical protein